jgi:hypothetical protein
MKKGAHDTVGAFFWFWLHCNIDFLVIFALIDWIDFS